MRAVIWYMFPLLPFDLIVIISFWPSLIVKGTLDLKHILPLSNLERGSTISCAVTVTVQLKGRCWAVMKMWKLCHTDVFDCGERQTTSHLTTFEITFFWPMSCCTTDSISCVRMQDCLARTFHLNVQDRDRG